MRAIRWVLVNTAMYAVMWFAVSGNAGCGRVLGAMLWLSAVCNVFAWLNDDIGAAVRKNGRSVPDYVSLSYDAAMTLTLVWFGWWLTALASFLSMLGEIGIYTDGKKEVTE